MGPMKRQPVRVIRPLAPIPLGPNRELRLELVEVSGRRRVSMATWARGDRNANDSYLALQLLRQGYGL